MSRHGLVKLCFTSYNIWECVHYRERTEEAESKEENGGDGGRGEMVSLFSSFCSLKQPG